MKYATGDKLYMDTATGGVDTYDGWWYENECGEKVNAVDIGEVKVVNEVATFGSTASISWKVKYAVSAVNDTVPHNPTLRHIS